MSQERMDQHRNGTGVEMQGDRPRYLVVEGIIGAGKTTLSEEIASRWEAEHLAERFEENPFLERYYLDPARYAFQTQLFFLLNRYEQLGVLRQLDLFRGQVVSDFSFDKDQLFASVTLRPEERAMYEQIRASLSEKIPSPDMIILLQASPASALDRIAERGRPMEEPISRDYLASLADAYVERFVRNPRVPTLIVDTDRYDPRHSDVLDLILHEVENRRDRLVWRFAPEQSGSVEVTPELDIPREVFDTTAGRLTR